MGHKLVEVSVLILHTTDYAFLVTDPKGNGAKRVWLAKSLVDYDETDKIMTMPDWLFTDKELDSWL